MTHMRVLITGSRSWRDTEAVHTALDALARSAAQSGYSGLTVVHGGAKGADRTAALWVTSRQREGWPVEGESHPVSGREWREHGNLAGHRRNARMVEAGADVCLAFVNPCESERCRRPRPHGTHGTVQCAELAEAEGIRLVRITPRAGGLTGSGEYADSPPEVA